MYIGDTNTREYVQLEDKNDNKTKTQFFFGKFLRQKKNKIIFLKNLPIFFPIFLFYNFQPRFYIKKKEKFLYSFYFLRFPDNKI